MHEQQHISTNTSTKWATKRPTHNGVDLGNTTMPKFLANPVRVFPWLSSDQVPDSHFDVPRWYPRSLGVVAIWVLDVLEVRSHCCAWSLCTAQREVQRRLWHQTRLKMATAEWRTNRNHKEHHKEITNRDQQRAPQRKSQIHSHIYQQQLMM